MSFSQSLVETLPLFLIVAAVLLIIGATVFCVIWRAYRSLKRPASKEALDIVSIVAAFFWLVAILSLIAGFFINSKTVMIVTPAIMVVIMLIWLRGLISFIVDVSDS